MSERIGRPIELPEPWRALAVKVGGTLALISELGITRSTLYRWVKGVQPRSLHTKRWVNEFAADNKCRKPFK